MIYKLTGRLQHYIWGGESYIPSLLKQPQQAGQHYAEYWLGTHNSAPSILDINGENVSLLDFLAQNPEALGKQNFAKFGGELPYLLKVLDVAQPLSIQLHPTKSEAELGFERENQLGIDLNASNRTYKDRNHKPEMMIALSDFWLLHGFKTIAQIKQTFAQYPSLKSLVLELDTQGLPAIYAKIMQADQTQLARWLLPIIQEKTSDYQQNRLPLSSPDYWLFYTMEAMAISLDKLDAGLLCFYLFNIVHLKTGEGIYQGAGLPHAYLRGQNIELMACSDNVIRGGLTPKYVDINALLATIDYQEVVPKIIPKAKDDEIIHHYPTPLATDFALTRLTFKPFSEKQFSTENASILLVMSGSLYIELAERTIQLEQGQSVFIGANTIVDTIGESEGYAVIATLP